MERGELLAFLETIGAGSFESYLRRYGEDPLSALDERLAWAAWNAHAVGADRVEAHFLMENHEALRAVVEEGETAWHLRLKRAEKRAKRGEGLAPGTFTTRSAAPAPPRDSLPPAVPGALRRHLVTPVAVHSLHTEPPPVRPAEPPRAPEAARAGGTHAERLQDGRRVSERPTPARSQPPDVPTPGRSSARLAPHRDGGNPMSQARTLVPHRPSEAPTLLLDEPPGLPGGLSRTLPELDPGDTPPRPLALAKTGLEDDDGLRPGPGIVRGSAAPPPPRELAPRGPFEGIAGFAVGVGLGLAGLGALALAGAVVAGLLSGRPEAPRVAPPTPTVAPAPPVEAQPPPPAAPAAIAPPQVPPAAPSARKPPAPAVEAAPAPEPPPAVVAPAPTETPARPPSRVVGADLRGNWVGTSDVGSLLLRLEWQRDDELAGLVVLDLGRGKRVELDLVGTWDARSNGIWLRDPSGELSFEGVISGETAKGTWRYVSETGKRSWFVVKQ